MTVVPEKTVSKWRELVSRVIYASRQGQIPWEEGVRDQEVIASIGKLVLSLRREEQDMVITISDEFGNLVDSFRDTDIQHLNNGRIAFHELVELHREALRSISGADEVLEKLIESLPPDPSDEIPF